MRIFARIGLVLVVLVIAGVAVGGIAVRNAMRGPLTTLDGAFEHPSLDAEVTVRRDDWGVPHITAQTAHDAYFAYGFVVAQDRLFQLEVLRRLGRGELSEVLGPGALATDKLSRTLLWLKTAERLLEDRSRFSDDFNVMMDAFLEGLNYYIETQPLPVEFSILGIEPTPFEAADSLSIMGYMAYGFADGVKSDSLYAIVKQRNPDVDPRSLFPGYDYDSPVTVMEGIVGPDKRSALEPDLGERVAAAAEAHLRRRNVDPDRLAAMVGEIEASFAIFGGFRGSNSWVLGPNRTVSGGAILANDPHIGFSNPAVWYECHMTYPGYENYGVHLPVIPFPIIGHNRDRAWSMTMFTNDDLDLYRETFNPNNPEEVMYRGEWTRVERWTETIAVSGAEPEELEITVTPHGPIVTDLIQGYAGDPVAAWWLFHDIDAASMQAFYGFAQARDMDEMRAAAADLMAPGINLSYADRDGNIAWWASARLAIRPDHVNAKDILDGASGTDEILGFLPFEDNPQLENPDHGLIVTSNNMSTTGPVGSIDALEAYWQPTDRAGRILDLLEGKETWALEDLKAVQTDYRLRSAAQLVPAMIRLLEANADAVGSFQGAPREAYGAVSAWDYDHGIDSVGATVFHYWYDALQRRLAIDEIGEDVYPSYLSIADSKQMVKAALTDPSYPLWDDIRTPEREAPADVTLGAFMEAVDELQSELGPDFESWRWGNVHTVTYGHILGNVPPLDRLWNIGPLPAPGTEESVAKMAWSTERYAVTSGASMRKLIDYGRYGEPGGVLFVLPTGNSGNVMSPHFRDQAEMYLRGEYRELHVTNEAIEANTRSVTTLKPEA